MIKPDVLDSELPHGPWSCRGCDIWEAMCAAEAGDVPALRRLLERDPNLYRAEYWYTQPIHFAVREGHLEAAKFLVEAGADPAAVSLGGDNPVTIARDRGHEAVARWLEDALERRGRSLPADSSGAAATADFQPIDLALWDGPYWGLRGDLETARRLVDEGAVCDLVIASALGELEQARAILDEEPGRIAESRPSGKRALSSAVELGHEPIVRLLLKRGADPNWPEGANAPRGVALHAAARAGNRPLVELLLAHGADPNGYIDASGSATYAAKTRELRALLIEHGGSLDAYDLIWLGEDDEAVRRVAEDPSSAHAGCGGVFAAACTLGKRDLVVRLLDAGARVPPVVTACRSYLWSEPETLRLLLEGGMDPDLPNWQRATPLHDLCSRDGRGRPRPVRVECASLFLGAGATISAKDEEYRSTPLAWAARNGLADMVELLLARGAKTELADDEPWARPLAWARRRGHHDIAAMLGKAGAA